MITLRKRGQSFHVDYVSGSRRMRGTLGTKNKDVAFRLKNRLENALAEGSASVLWTEISQILPESTYRSFASFSGVQHKEVPTWSNLTDIFTKGCKIKAKMGNLAPGTFRNYNDAIKNFGEFLAQENLNNLNAITSSLIDSYKMRRLDEILKHKHARNGNGLVAEMIIIRRVFAVGVEHEMIKKNPIKRDPLNKSTQGAEPYTPQEIGQLYEVASPREKDIMTLLRWTGFRRGDAVDHRWSEVNLATQEVDRVAGKNKKRVIIPMHPDLLDMYQRRKEENKPMSCDPVLGSRALGGPLRPDNLYTIVRDLGTRAKVKRAHPHRFRDTFAVTLLAKGATLYETASLLGDTTRTVEMYYAAFIKDGRDRVRTLMREK